MQKVRLGIIGVSGRGALAKHWHNPGGSSEVVAGADINPGFLDEFKKKTKENTFITTDYKKLLEREDVDAVAITSPDFTHEEYAVGAFRAGKHVFCEKPMAITPEGCDKMMREWRKSGKKFIIGHNMCCMRIFRAMKDIADSGLIGERKAARVRHFAGAGGDFYHHDWHARSDKSSGLLLQKGGHGGADPVICKDFIDMTVKNTEPVATPEARRMSVAAGYAATISIRNGGQTIQIPPVNKENKK